MFQHSSLFKVIHYDHFAWSDETLGLTGYAWGFIMILFDGAQHFTSHGSDKAPSMIIHSLPIIYGKIIIIYYYYYNCRTLKEYKCNMCA